jgi:hypothetical protein
MKRRYMMLGLTLLLTLVLLAAVAGPVAAEGAGRSTFTMEQPTVILLDPGVMNHVGDIRGARYVGDLVSSDGRVAGEITTVVNVSFTSLGPSTFDIEARMWGTFHIENDAGSWEGTWRGLRGPGLNGIHIIDAVGGGSGAYEGLRITFHMEEWVGTGQVLNPGRH